MSWKNIYVRNKEVSNGHGLRQDSNPRRQRQLRLAIKRHQLIYLRHYAV